MLSKTFKEAIVAYMNAVKDKCEDTKEERYSVAYAAGECLPKEAQDKLVEAYNRLWDDGDTLEAYILLRVAFGHISLSRLIKLHERNRLLRERDFRNEPTVLF